MRTETSMTTNTAEYSTRRVPFTSLFQPQASSDLIRVRRGADHRSQTAKRLPMAKPVLVLTLPELSWLPQRRWGRASTITGIAASFKMKENDL